MSFSKYAAILRVNGALLVALVFSLATSIAAHAAITQLGTPSSLFQSAVGTVHSMTNVTVPAGTDRVLIVTASHAGYVDVTSVSFGASPMIKAVERDDTVAVDSIWFLRLGNSASPTTATISATFATPSSGQATPATQSFISAVTYAGVDQTVSVNNPQSAMPLSGSNVGSSFAVTSASGNLVFDIFDGFNTGAAVTATAAAGQTLLVTGAGSITGSGAGFARYSTSTTPGAASTTMAWTSNSQSVLHVAVNIIASPACPSTVVTNGNDSGAGSLRQTIANACAGSTVTFQPGVTTVTLTSAEIAINKNLTIDGGTSMVTVTRSTAGGTPNFRIFNVLSGNTVSMNALTVSNGNHPTQSGGIQNSGSLTLTNMHITGNRSPQSAGLQNDSVLNLSNSSVTNNIASSFAGGLGIAGAGTTILSNCTFSGNQGGSDTGAIGAGGTALTITNCTISGNTLVNAFGVGAGITTNGVPTTIRNTIVIGNTEGNGSQANIDGTLQAASAFNVIGTGTPNGGLTNGTNNNQVGVPTALLGSLANYGGLTPTLPLLPGSVAINAGTNVSAPTNDQRGIARVVSVDVGAFESRGFSLTQTSGSPQTAVISTAFASPLIATVASTNSEPVQGGVVRFTAPGAGASATLGSATATIAANGQASTSAAANATIGSYTVSANMQGNAGSALSFGLTNRALAADLSITKTNGTLSSSAGGTTTYTIVASNAGPDAANSATVADTFPAACTAVSWTCVGAGGGTCNASGSANINSVVNLPAGGSTTFTAMCSIAPLATGTLTNTATVSSAVADPNPANNAATDTDTIIPPPTLTINDVSLSEGDSGTTNFTFTVSLSAPAGPGGVTFDIATANGTATAGSDYVARALTAQTIAAGSSTYSFTVIVNGDTTPEANETFFVNVTNVTGATVSDGQGLGTIQNDDVAVTQIHDIQGSGLISPLNGAVVTTEGIVTAQKFNNGFFLQTADANVDADPNTSQGIFVFTSTAPPSTAGIGNRVRVTGTVTEFTPVTNPNQRSITQLTSPTIVVLSTGNPLPAPVALTVADFNAMSNPGTAEKFEGMRVTIGSARVVEPSGGNIVESSASSSTTGVFHVVLNSVVRPFREPGIGVMDVFPIPGGKTPPIFDTNQERIAVLSRGQVSATAIAVEADATISNMTGVLDYSAGTWALLPDVGSGAVSAGKTPVAVSDAASDEVTIASVNLQRFFDEVNDSNGAPTLTAAALDKRLTKASIAICDFVKAPHILGVTEVENLRVLGLLADRINSTCASAPQYVPYLVQGNDVGGINVGFLVSNRSVGPVNRVEVLEVTQFGKNSMLVNPDTSSSLLNDRPPLLLRAIVNASNGASYPVTVIVNHLRSMNGLDDTSPGSSGWSTEGARVRAKRGEQAMFLANLIQARQTTNPAERIVVLGDFNANEFNDGYVDVMGILRGNAAAASSVIADYVSPITQALTDSASLITNPTEKYSEVSAGSAQSLTHILINAPVVAAAPSIRVEHARINADFGVHNYGVAGNAVRFASRDPIRIAITTAPPISVNPATLVNGTVGVSYSETLSASGGTGAYGFAVTSGALPGGLTLAPSGAITGTPNAAGPFNFTITATDSSSAPGPFTGSRAYTVNIAQGVQTLTFAPASPVVFGVTPITLTASATSGLTTFNFSTTSANTICTVAGNQLTIVGVGTCALTATQPGNANYASASLSASIAINPATQTVTFTPTSPVVFGIAPITLTASATSGLTAFSYSTTSANTICTVAGNQLTITGAGVCNLTATQPGNANYLSASANATVTINPATQTVTFAPASPVIFGAAPVVLSAAATSGLTTFNFATTSAASICTVAGNTVTFTGGGACALTATQPGNANFQSASASATIVVNPGTQTVTFTPATPVTFGAAPTTLSATASSGLTTFAFSTSSSSSVCTVVGNTLTYVGAGSCSLTATQAGNASYQSASATVTVVITAANQTVTFAPASPVVFGVVPITLTATATSGLTTFNFSTTSANSICTVAGNQLTIVGVGTCALTATQPGNANFASTSTNASVVINQASQTVTFAPTTPVNVGAAPMTLTATATSGQTNFTFITSSPNTVCTVAGNQLTIVGVGTCALTATQAGNANYLSASANANVAVNQGTQTVSFAPATPVNFGATPITLSATATSGLTNFTFSTSSANTICTVAGNLLTIVGVGSCAVTATQPGNASYASASANASVVINAVVPGAPTIGTGTPGNAQASIAFIAPSFTGGAAVSGYTASCVGGAITVTASGSASPVVVTGLTNGTTYDCTVVANNSVGAGSASAPVSVTPSFRSYTAVSPTGGGTITASFTGGGAACSYGVARYIPVAGDSASPPAGSAPAGISFPYGLFDFTTIGCTPGSTITLTISYPGTLPVTTQYWKYGPTPTSTTPNWYVLPASVGGNIVSFTITDGQLGDDDLAANGTIVDQGGPGIPPALPVPVNPFFLWALGLLMAGLASIRLRPLAQAK